VLLELDDVSFHLNLNRSQADHDDITDHDDRNTQNFAALGKNKNRRSIFSSSLCIKLPAKFWQLLLVEFFHLIHGGFEHESVTILVLFAGNRFRHDWNILP